MKKLLIAVSLLVVTLSVATSCKDDDYESAWKEYADWRETNEQYLAEQARLEGPDGKALYERVVPSWNTGVYVLIRYFNDRKLTENNLVPLSTSTVDVKYKGMLYNDVPFDSSYNNKASYGDSLYRTRVNADIIDGWKIALQHMHVGDSAEVLLPYNVGYGYSGSGSILPFSTLKFHIKLVDIPYYEIRN